jgi:hypothetical protein
MGKQLEKDFALRVLPRLELLRLPIRFLPVMRVAEKVEVSLGAAGGQGAHRWSVKNPELPEGLRLDLGENAEICTLRGTPREVGPVRLNVSVTDGVDTVGPVVVEGVVLPVPEPLRLITRSVPVFFMKEPVQWELGATGGHGSYRWDVEVREAPEGLELKKGEGGRCFLTGAPEAPGEVRVQVSVTDGFSTVGPTQVKGEVVRAPAAPLRIPETSLPSWIYGRFHSERFAATGGKLPYKWKIRWHEDPGPVGVQFDPETGRLSGTPQRVGEHSFDLSLTDDLGFGITRKDLSLEIAVPPRSEEARIIPAALPLARTEKEYEAVLRLNHARGHVAWDIAWEAEQPDWLQIRQVKGELVLSGVPDRGGAWRCRIRAREWDRASSFDATGASMLAQAGADLELKAIRPYVHPPAPQLLTRHLPTAVAGREYRTWLATSDGESPLIYKLVDVEEGEFPGWLRLGEDGALHGTPPAAGIYEFSAVVSDYLERTDSGRLTLRVLEVQKQQSLRVGEFSPPAAVRGKEYIFRLPVVGGVKPYHAELHGELPPGLSLDPDQVAIVGVPESTGSTQVELTVSDAGNSSQELAPKFNLKVLRPDSDYRRLMFNGVALILLGFSVLLIVRWIRERKRLSRPNRVIKAHRKKPR